MAQRVNVSFGSVRDDVFPSACFDMHLRPFQSDDLKQQYLGKAMLAHHPHGVLASARGEFDVACFTNPEPPVSIEALHGLADGRHPLPQSVGKTCAQWKDAVLFKF